MQEALIEKLFGRHFSNPQREKVIFLQRLQEIGFEFDLLSQLREHDYPPQLGVPQGLPSEISYHIPGTAFGSIKKGSGSTFQVDGIGLNLGCPLRLARALHVLYRLPSEQRPEILAALRSPRGHLTRVEELLWASIWRSSTNIERGGSLVSRLDDQVARDIDWFFYVNGTPIYLEAKFRQNDWLRHVDAPNRLVSKKFFDGIGGKFPKEAPRIALHLAGITGFADILNDPGNSNSTFRALVEHKLRSTPGLSAILYRQIIGPITIMSLSASAAERIAAALSPFSCNDYPGLHSIPHSRSESAARQALGEGGKPIRESGKLRLIEHHPTGTLPFALPGMAYRYSLKAHRADGEPVYEMIPSGPAE